MTTLAHGTMEMNISQEDVMQAVEFWLNEKVLKNPGVVTHLSGQYQGSSSEWSFKVKFLEDAGEVEPCDEAGVQS